MEKASSILKKVLIIRVAFDLEKLPLRDVTYSITAAFTKAKSKTAKPMEKGVTLTPFKIMSTLAGGRKISLMGRGGRNSEMVLTMREISKTALRKAMAIMFANREYMKASFQRVTSAERVPLAILMEGLIKESGLKGS
jgi:hypothetical protein